MRSLKSAESYSWYRRMRRRCVALALLESLAAVALLLASAKVYSRGRYSDGWTLLVLAICVIVQVVRDIRNLRRWRRLQD